MILLRPISLILALCLTSCHLVDQRDFDAKAGVKPVPPVVAGPPVHTLPALVTIRYTTPNPDYHDVLTDAVHKALDAKPDVLFSVATLIPPVENADSSADAQALAAASGREVAQTIVAAGASPGQVEQLVSVDPTASVREVVVRVQ
jgi:hypothetical protein